MNLMVETTFRWVSMTPCGCPVLPDVYWRNARSSASGSAYAGAAASASRSDGSRTARTPGACAADSSTPLRNQPIVATAPVSESLRIRAGDKLCLIYPTCAEFFFTFFGHPWLLIHG